MLNKNLILLFLLSGAICFAQDSKHYSIGEIQKLNSKILNEQRQLNIHLPLNFSRDSSYPVIYVLDGSASEDFLHIVGLVQFFQLQFSMPDFIIVGIENVDRKRDFTFHSDLKDLKTNFPSSGKSAFFIDFVEKEMKPFINTKYKTNGTNYLIGQSLGGLLASEILLKKPELFSHYLIVSPSMWWDDRSLLKQADLLAKRNILLPVYISLTVGAKEHRIMKRGARTLKNKLKNKKNEALTLKYNRMKKENHATILHNALYESLEELFPFKK